ncbi:unnamed protein product [Ambrosiozyma monospora]|uniref:Unnamed protein product n=1 Tax=Ambrosiozyma monospora TaxID=43982 RepID=A0ACB5TAX7_AMBMO|nr:unnamed protein product [Ambrosiozyma monospora]
MLRDAKTDLEVIDHKNTQTDNIEQGNTTSAIDGDKKEIANGKTKAEPAVSEPTKTSTSTTTETPSSTKKYSSLLPPPLPPKDYDCKSRNASAGSSNSANGHAHHQSHHSHTSHHSHHQLEEPISLEECLNSYFNNSVTVRRHLDKKRMYDTIPSKDGRPDASDKKDDSNPNGTDHKDDMEEYAKRGIVTSESNCPTTVSECPEGSLYEAIDGVKGAVVHEEVASITDLTETLSNSTIGESLSGIDQCTSTIERTGTVGSASYSKVSDKLEASRTRSSTIVSVLNNAAAATSNSGSASAQRTLTRRKSSVSNTEVSLPAWMFLQLLPYYNDPKAKLQFENHEEYYRRRASRSKTLDSVEFDINANNDSSGTSPAFDKRFGDKRPIIPICLKRYVWDNQGHTHKIHRKVIIPQVIRYPYFIAEDRVKKGYVDFRRSSQNVAPFGSFMLVLESCVCHRGSSVNSGHYVSLTRKHPYRYGQKEEDAVWLLFNDMQPKMDKTKEMKFEEAMEKEDPYILFYRIVDLDEETFSEYSADESSTIKPPKGSREKYWSESDNSSQVSHYDMRKLSVVSQKSAVSGIAPNQVKKGSDSSDVPPQQQQQPTIKIQNDSVASDSEASASWFG